MVEEDTDGRAPTPVRPASAGASGARPPLHNRGSSPSAFVVPTQRSKQPAEGRAADKSSQRGLKSSSSVVSNSSIAFQFEEEPSVSTPQAAVPPKRPGVAASPPPPRANAAAAVDNASIAFRMEDSQDGALWPVKTSGGKAANKGSATSRFASNDSIAFQVEEDSPSSGAGPRTVSPTARLPPAVPSASRGAASQALSAAAATAATRSHSAGVTNDSIAFHFEDELSQGSAPQQNQKPAAAAAAKAVAAGATPTFRLADTTHNSAGSDLDNRSIAFHEEDSSLVLTNVQDTPKPAERPALPPAPKRSGGAATGFTASAPSPLRPDASISSIQFATDSEADAAPEAPPQAFVGTPSAAGAEAGRQRKTVVSNHLKNSSARNSPARTRPSAKATPETHPPLYQPRRAAQGLEAGAGNAEPSTPAEAAEAARQRSREADAADAADAGEPPQGAEDVDGGGAAKVRTASRRDKADGSGRTRRHSTGSDADPHSHHHRRRRHRVPRTASSAAHRDEGQGLRPAHAQEAPSEAQRAPAVEDHNASPRSRSSSAEQKANRQVSESMPNTARTRGPDGQGSASRQETGATLATPSSSVDEIVSKHLDRVAAENAYFRHGHERVRQGSLPDPRARNSRSDTMLMLPPPASADAAARGGGVHHRSSTKAFADPEVGAFSVSQGAAEEAARQADMWRAFNEQQREEIERLQRRIAAAKRQDRTALDPGYLPQPAATQPTPTSRRPSPAARPVATAPPRTRSTGPGYANATPGARHVARMNEAAPATEWSVGQHQQGRRPRGNRTPSPSPQPRHTTPHPHAPNAHTSASAAAAATVASLLGVLWPPVRPGELYFVTGSRLTPQQVEGFYETVHVQQQQQSDCEAAATKATATALTVLSPSKALRSQQRHSPSLARTPSAVATHRRPAMRRSHVLREVFDLLDCNKRGLLYASEVPALQHLITVELAKLEAQTPDTATAAATVPSPHSGGRRRNDAVLWEAAAREHDMYAKAYAGLSRGLSVVDKGIITGPALPGYDRTPSPPTGSGRHHGINKATRLALLLSFAVNVVLPLAAASRIHALDFPTLSLVVFAAVDRNDPALMQSPEGQAWRRVVTQYFDILS